MIMEDESKWAEVQLTREQAIAMAETGVWQHWTAEQVVRFQLFQERLCMDFGHFSKSISEVLGRPVYTHEFACSNRDNLVLEYLGERPTPTLDEIIDLIPALKGGERRG